MDDFTLRHFETWLGEHFRPELIAPAKERMLRTYAEDPEWWNAQGWRALADAADAWSVEPDCADFEWEGSWRT